MKNVNVTLFANRLRDIDWLPQIYSKAPPSGKTTSSPILKLEIANNLNYTFVVQMICTVYNILHMLAFSG
jgi:hypothetical protein